MKTNQVGRTLLGHKQWVTALCWEPLHLTSVGQSGRMASAGKDGDVRIWNTRLGTCEKVCQKKSIYIGLYFTYRLDNFIIMFIMLKGQNQELCIFYVVCLLLFCFLFFFSFLSIFIWPGLFPCRFFQITWNVWLHYDGVEKDWSILPHKIGLSKCGEQLM